MSSAVLAVEVSGPRWGERKVMVKLRECIRVRIDTH